MTDRFATVLVADEIYYNLHGKAILQGVYNTDIMIGNEEQQANQLIFFFVIETDIANPFRTVKVEVTLPGNEPVSNFVAIQPTPLLPGRTRSILRWPLLIPAPKLRTGRIEAKVIHESGEILASVPWIISPQTVAAVTQQ
jgi:hypothetical protein